MSNDTLGMPQVMLDYLRANAVQESSTAKQCREDTARHPDARMQIAPEQGQLLAFLVKLVKAKRIVEIGVFTGYSSLWMAEALPDDGEIVACDCNTDYTRYAEQYWQQAGVANKITLRIGRAVDTLEQLLTDEGAGQFDMAFIDADKESELLYLEAVRSLVRQNGLILIDNAFWSGKVADPSAQDQGTKTIRKVIRNVFTESDQPSVIVPIADGLIMLMNSK